MTWSSKWAMAGVVLPLLAVVVVQTLIVQHARQHSTQLQDVRTAEAEGNQRSLVESLQYIRPGAQENLEAGGTKLHPSCFAEDGALKSPICSIGQARAFSGSIDAAEATQAAFVARAFQKELIIVSALPEEGPLVMNLLLQLKQHGYEHYLLLMPDEDSCRQLMVAHATLVDSCVWSGFMTDSHPTRHWSEARRLGMLRWMLLLRALQHHLNVLLLQPDSIVSTDFYRYVKDPLFTPYTLIAAPERTIPGVGAAVVYVHNASPTGPVAWVAAEVADRTLRLLEQGEDWLLERNPALEADPAWIDRHALLQSNLLNDVVCSSLASRPVFFHALAPHAVVQQEQHKAWEAVHVPHCMSAWFLAQQEWPAAWANVTHAAASSMSWHEMHLPVAGGEWPAELGAAPYRNTAARAPWSQALQDWLTSGGRYEMWEQDAEGQPTAAAAEKAAQERLLRAPEWLITSWEFSGAHGWWDPTLILPARGVLAHVAVPPTNDPEARLTALKIAGQWHWSATAPAADAAPLPFRSSVPEQPLPKVLLLAPSVAMCTASFQHYLHLAHHLAKVAVLAGRVVVWPRVSCWSPWIEKAADWSGQLDGRSDPSPVVDGAVMLQGPARHCTCMPLELLTQGCHTYGMSLVDFHHLSELLPPEQLVMSKRNTLFMQHMQQGWPDVFDPQRYPPPAARVPGKGPVPPLQGVLDVDAQAVLEALSGKQDEPVLYLGYPLRVHGLPPEFQPALDALFNLCPLPGAYAEAGDPLQPQPEALL